MSSTAVSPLVKIFAGIVIVLCAVLSLSSLHGPRPRAEGQEKSRSFDDEGDIPELPPLSDNELATLSDLIVVAEVVNSVLDSILPEGNFPEGTNGVPRTSHTMRAVEVVKGDIQPGDEFTLRQEGALGADGVEDASDSRILTNGATYFVTAERLPEDDSFGYFIFPQESGAIEITSESQLNELVARFSRFVAASPTAEMSLETSVSEPTQGIPTALSSPSPTPQSSPTIVETAVPLPTATGEPKGSPVSMPDSNVWSPTPSPLSSSTPVQSD